MLDNPVIAGFRWTQLVLLDKGDPRLLLEIWVNFMEVIFGMKFMENCSEPEIWGNFREVIFGMK